MAHFSEQDVTTYCHVWTGYKRGENATLWRKYNTFRIVAAFATVGAQLLRQMQQANWAIPASKWMEQVQCDRRNWRYVRTCWMRNCYN